MFGQTNASSDGIGTHLKFFKGYDPHGNRVRIDTNYNPYPWNEFSYLTGSIRSFLAAVDGNGHPWITGADLRQALEVAIAAKLSATRNSTPVKLPLEDRSLALYPRPYRWIGGMQPVDLRVSQKRQVFNFTLRIFNYTLRIFNYTLRRKNGYRNYGLHLLYPPSATLTGYRV